MHPTTRDFDLFKQIMSSFNRLISTYPPKIWAKKDSHCRKQGGEKHLIFSEGLRCPRHGFFQFFNMFRLPVVLVVPGMFQEGDLWMLRWLGDLVATMLKKEVRHRTFGFCVLMLLFFHVCIIESQSL